MWKGTKKNGEKKEAKDTWRGVKTDIKVLKTRHKHGRI
jgi:hypothetical protein